MWRPKVYQEIKGVNAEPNSSVHIKQTYIDKSISHIHIFSPDLLQKIEHLLPIKYWRRPLVLESEKRFYEIKPTATFFADFLAQVHCVDSGVINIMVRTPYDQSDPSNIHLLIAVCVQFCLAAEKTLLENIELGLKLSSAIMQFLRFAQVPSKKYQNISQTEQRILINCCDYLVQRISSFSPIDYKSALNYDMDCLPLRGELFLEYLLQRKNLQTRLLGDDLSNLESVHDMAIRRKDEILLVARIRHNEIYGMVTETWLRGKNSFESAKQFLDKECNNLRAKDLNKLNEDSPSWRNHVQTPKQGDYDLNTSTARIFSLSAGIILRDVLSSSNKIRGRAQRDVELKLKSAYDLFTKNNSVWWHGYANHQLILALYSYARGEHKRFSQELNTAIVLFHKTSDVQRQEQIILFDKGRDYKSNPLTENEVDTLLFGE